jgi:hypothetical protein
MFRMTEDPPVEGMSSKPKPPETLDRLLTLLDSDPAKAERKYLKIHRRLVKILAWNRCSDPNELANEA